MQRIAQVWPGWQADELLGQGGFGKVYRASRTLGGYTTEAAIKIIDIPHDESGVEELRSMGMDTRSIRSCFEDTAKRVIDEVATMDRLKGSPHVVHIEDYQLLEREDGIGWTVLIRMELLEPLDTYLRNHPLTNVRDVVKIGLDVCDALAACHEANIIHRDVKPANVFRSAYGEYKLGDFGIAKRLDEATRSTKSHAGTDSYMAPEVATGHYDHTVDIYSLGIMLYRWLNGGRPPFLPPSGMVTQADLERSRARRLSGERPPLPAGSGVPKDLAQIVQKACEPKPDDRWESAAQFARALSAWTEGEEVIIGESEEQASSYHQDQPRSTTGRTFDLFSALGGVDKERRAGVGAEKVSGVGKEKAAGVGAEKVDGAGKGNDEYLTVEECIVLICRSICQEAKRPQPEILRVGAAPLWLDPPRATRGRVRLDARLQV